MANVDQERTEQATPKKRQDERRKGNVAKSQDIIAAVSFIGIVLLFLFSSNRQADYAYTLFHDSLSQKFVLQTDVAAFASYLSKQILRILGELFFFFTVVVLASAAGNILQSGFLYLPNKCAPDFSRINPFKNFTKLLSWNTLLQILLGCVKLTIVLCALCFTLKGDVDQFISLPHGSPIQIILFSVHFFKRLGLTLCGTLLAIAVADYILKRFKYEKDIRMTPQELKEELREESGDPIVKGKRRSMSASILNSTVTPPEKARPTSPISLYRNSKRSNDDRDDAKNNKSDPL